MAVRARGEHDTCSFGFLPNLPGTQARGAARMAPSQQGEPGALFVPGKMFFGAVQELQ